jgi:hypothetical protein
MINKGITTNFFFTTLIVEVFGSGMGKKSGVGINIPVPQHCKKLRKNT